MLEPLGRFAVRRRWLVIAAWGAVLLAGALIGSQVFSRLATGTGTRDDVESARVERLLDAAGGLEPDLLILLDGKAVTDARVTAAVQELAADVRTIPDVVAVTTASATGPGRSLISADGQAQLVAVDLRGGIEPADSASAIDAVRARAEAVDMPRVLVGGEVALQTEFQRTSEEQLARGEMIALPIMLVLLLLFFRGFLAAALPLLVAVVAVPGALLVLLAVSYATTLSAYAVNVITMVGLGLAVDYALLLVSRFREERAAGLDVDAAVVRCVTSAGRTVAFSAVIVTVALAGLLVFAEPLLRSMAWGAVGVVLLTVLAALTLVPALLTLWGHRIRIPASAGRDGGLFFRLSRFVQRFALVVAPLLIIGLALLALPVRHAEWGGSGPESLPAGSATRQLAEVVEDRFPGGGVEPVVVVADVPPAAVADLTARLAALPGAAGAQVREQAPAGTTVIDVLPRDGAGRDLVHDIRALDEPLQVGGADAALADFHRSVGGRIPWALALIVVATFVLLFLMTGSLVVPAKAIVMNVLSLGASFGALVFIFQDGNLSGPLDFTPSGSIDSTVPLLIFVFAFGLSMDYEVFLLARIKEEYDRTGDNDLAVAVGLQRTGSVVTSAAALMVVVFLGFAAGGVLTIKELGVGMALTILIDATVVRSLLVPAVMKLMGRANWWAPRPLRRAYQRVAISEHRTERPAIPERV
ncbi:MMPL family transporter [Virgisporangium aurantiacum]|uniref:MMPL family transporter n=1 Tax=Virgisporangium aurantiacum TaxID=175570 RepID=UPI00195122DA|nr:MMPL family transporter [Virgisporangium aurantiacum]